MLEYEDYTGIRIIIISSIMVNAVAVDSEGQFPMNFKPSSSPLILRIITHRISPWTSVSTGTLLALLSKLSLKAILKTLTHILAAHHTNTLM